MPRGWAVKPIQRLKAGMAWPWARNSVPTVSPATMRARLPGVRPLAMITFSPAVVAMRAASSLLAMPPLLSPVTESRTRARIDAIEPGDGGDQLRLGVARVAVEQAVDVGQQHQQRGADQVGDHGGQPVVVAEGGLQLVDADRVVFVDDRHGAELEQRQNRVADVEISGAVVEIVGGEQQLGGVAAVGPQSAVVRLDQVALPDGGHGLQLGQSRPGAWQA